MNNHPIIIIGMHRSGTSAFTRGLQRLGIDIGKKLDSNYEDIFFQNLNKFMLAQLGIEWDNPFYIKKALKNKTVRLSLINFLKSEFKNKKKVLWGFKDPRTVLLLDIWSAFFKNAKYIVIKRNKKEIYQSLINRNKIKMNSTMYVKNNLKFLVKKKFNLRVFPGLSPLCYDENYSKKVINFYLKCINDFKKKKYCNNKLQSINI